MGPFSTCDWLTTVADALEQESVEPSALVGFDGFVDTILHAVEERIDADHYVRMKEMRDFAGRIADAAGYSANLEMVPQTVKLGGNGPIMADGLMALGCRVVYAGAIGKPEIDPVFAHFAARCARVISMADPARTDAVEFVDGKLMLGKMTHLKEVDWAALTKCLSSSALEELLGAQDLVACVNWTMLPNQNSILEGLEKALKRMHRRIPFFMDLADPRKRRSDDVIAVGERLTALQGTADVILGMNEQESAQLARVLTGRVPEDLCERAQAIREKLQIHLAVIHPLRGAGIAGPSGTFFAEGPYTTSPRLTTGAGDTFNAGFCYGLLSGLDPEQSVGAGFCASGFYVRAGRPPDRDELIGFMRRWIAAGCKELD